MARSDQKLPGFEIGLGGDADDVHLFADLLRDGRVALGTRGGRGATAEIHLLPAEAALSLAAWLTTVVEREWLATARRRANAQLQIADEVYGEDNNAARSMALDLLAELPPRLLARAMILLANSIGPQERARKVEALNQTEDFSADLRLRTSIFEERDALGYAVAAAALFDAISPDVAEF